MKHLLSTLALLLTLSTCLAFAQQLPDEMKGDVKMEEGMYEMALSYYNKAKNAATSSAQFASIEKKIAACQEKIKETEAAQQEEQIINTEKLVSGRYEESGSEYLFQTNEVRPHIGQYQKSTYDLVVYKERLMILGHVDKKTGTEMDFIPAGTDLLQREDCALYYSYKSQDDSICFIVFKAVHKNAYGEYRVILRKEGERYLKLDSMPEVKLKAQQAIAQRKRAEAEAKAKAEAEALPVIISDHWMLNIDADGKKLGDSRKGYVLYASELRWLALRLQYICPDDFEKILSFDIKIFGPNGKLMNISGSKPKKGYSTVESIKTVPGGGIFTVAIGGDKPGALKKGVYKFEIWHDGARYYIAEVELL